MRHHTITAAGAVAFTLAATLAGCSGDAKPTAGVGEATPTPSATSDPGCTEITDNRSDLPAGCYSVGLEGRSGGPRLELRLDEGFNAGGQFIWWHPDGGEWEGNLALWPAGAVYPDPCLRTGTADPGSTVDDFLSALDAQLVTDLSQPEPVNIGGFDGQYVELAVDPGYRYESCRDRELRLWASGPSTDGPIGRLQRYWVVQVGEDRVVISVLLPDDATPEMVARFTDVVETATFSPG